MVRFEDPGPGTKRARHDHRAIAAELRSRPDEWALILEDVSNNFANQIRNGVLAAYRPVGAYEATTRGNTPSGRASIYARYVGGPDE